jgi:serine/threonine protein kinase/tetratricopeptide (TPR) repeat protein
MPEPISEQSILLQALALPTPAERAAYLEEACRDNPELRAEVEALLAAHERLGGLPLTTGERPAGSLAAEPVPDTVWSGGEVGAVLAGRYKLVQKIGEGGMGTVWMAQQTEPVKRLVALKVIKPGMDSRQVLARFEAERQALALMDHPNIARVLDAGTTDRGRPFFVMELVKGVPLTKYCDEHRLTPKERLELFVPVCQAIQHAHQKGVIHRDIKPSNVLVARYDGKPVPKVIDFGVAKATGQQLTEHTLVTGFGTVVGTLEYMSPEQAEINQLDIDTRSDIYSLGVLLYELLTGTTPLERKRLKQAAMLEVLRLIREEEPPRPSVRLSSTEQLPSVAANRGLEPKKLRGLVRGELDWIVMKALEKERSRRYETANGLAMDVQRYLADDPVLACPPSAWYRLRKFTRRNKASLTAGVLIVLALVLGTVVSTWQAIRATQAADAERKTRLELDAAREEKEQQRARTNRGLSDALVEVVRLQEKVRGARPGDAEPVNQLRAMLARAGTLATNELVDPALVGQVRAVQAEMDQGEKDRRMVARLEAIRLNKGTVEGGHLVTVVGATAPAYREAFQDYGLPITDIMNGNAPAGRIEEVARRIAASAIRDALVAALDDCASNQHDLVVRLLPVARRVAENDAWRRRYFEARIRNDREAMKRLAKDPEALEQPPAILLTFASRVFLSGDRVRADQLLREAQRRHPADLWINLQLGRMAWNIKDNPEARIGFYRAALAARPENVALHHGLAGLLRRVNKQDEAIALYRQAIRLKPDNAYAYTEIGEIFAARNKRPELDDAIAACQKALEIDPKAIRATIALAIALVKKDEPDAAAAALQKAVAADQPPAGKIYTVCLQLMEREPDYSEDYNQLASVLARKGDRAGAIAIYRRVTELDPRNVDAHEELAESLDSKGDIDGAVAEYRKLIEVAPKYNYAYFQLAKLLQRKRDWGEAAAVWREAIELYPTSQVLHHLARLLATCPEEKFRDAAKAVELAKKAIAQAPEEGTYWNTLGIAHYRAGAWKSAVAAFDKSMEFRAGGDAFDWLFLAMAYEKLGKRDEARKRYDQAVEWLEKNGPMLANSPQEADELRRFRAEAEETLGLKKK